MSERRGPWDLNWTNGADYTSVTIQRDGEIRDILSGWRTDYTDTVPGPGSYSYSVRGHFDSQFGSLVCSATPCGQVEVTYVPPVTNMECRFDNGAVARLTWVLDKTVRYDGIHVSIDGFEVWNSPLDGTATDFAFEPLAPGWHDFSVQPYIGSYLADLAPPASPGPATCGTDPTPGDVFAECMYAKC